MAPYRDFEIESITTLPSYNSVKGDNDSPCTKEGDEKVDEDINAWTLPPKQLQPRGGHRMRIRYTVAVEIVALLVLGTILFGFLGYGRLVRHIPDHADNSCDKLASSAAERRLVIDLRIGGTMTFAQAKLIDVAWDLVFGQGGRFLHAWVLYHYVFSDNLIWQMEHATVPYHYCTNLSFSAVSCSSLGSLWRRLAQKCGWRSTLSLTALIYAILYVFAFPTIWSAATGYLSQTTRMYMMPGGTTVGLDSEELALCWSLKDERLDLTGDYVEMGPTFKDISRARGSSLGPSKRYSDVWSWLDIDHVDLAHHISNDFLALYDYAQTIRDFQLFFNATAYGTHFYDTILAGQASDEMCEITRDLASYDKNACSAKSTHRLPRHIRRNPSVHHKPNGKTYSNAYPKYSGQKYELDEMIDRGAGIVPYNSTLKFQSRSYQFSAPFLNVGTKCSPHNNAFTSLGSCVCYRQEPIEYDWYTDKNMFCMSSQGYGWGFSSFILLIGLCLETAWVTSCFGVWLDANVNSKLLKNGRSATGIVRNLLDIAESINRDLGPDSCAYSDAELQKALAQCDEIGYTVTQRDGVDHIGIVPRHMKQEVAILRERLYGRRVNNPA